MTDRYWVGTDGDFGVAANWEDKNESTGLPVAGDTMYLTGGGEITSNQDYFAAILLAKIVRTVGHEHAVVDLEVSATEWVWSVYGNSEDTVVATSPASIACDSEAGTLTIDGELTSLDIRSGTVTLPQCDVTTVTLSAIAKLITTDEGTISSVTSYGVAQVTANIGALTVLEGQWQQDDGDITSLNLYGGAVGFFSPYDVLGLARIRGGTLDLAQSALPRTISSLYVYSGGTVYLNNGVNNLTVTNIYCEGGVIQFSAGVELALTP
jgi:hypothetical protein